MLDLLLNHSVCSSGAVASPLLIGYIGPGVGLTAIGAFFALVVGLLVGIFGFVWYPVKRWLRRQTEKRVAHRDGATS